MLPDTVFPGRSGAEPEPLVETPAESDIIGEDTVIKKGKVYESHMFSVKDTCFKQEGFVTEVKEFYAGLINRYISDPEQQLKVFDPQSVYLPTKKIGKNNPKAEEIKADNAARQEWNRTAIWRF